MQSVFNEISLLCYFLVFWILEKRLNEKLFGRNWFHWYTADLDLCYHLFFQNAFFLLWKKIQTNIPIIASALQSRSSIFPVILKSSRRIPKSVGLKIEFVPISKQMRSISEYKSPVFLYCFFKNIKFETSSRLFLDIYVILSQVSYAFLYFFLFFIYVISYQVADYPAMSFICSINFI